MTKEEKKAVIEEKTEITAEDLEFMPKKEETPKAKPHKTKKEEE